MVDGLVWVIGEVGVVLVIFGSGVMNVIIGIVIVYMDFILLVIFLGQVVILFIGYDVFQECDMVGIFCLVVKYSFLVKQIEDIFGVLKKVFWLVVSGCFGLVVVDLLKDIFNLVKKLFYVWLDVVSMCLYNLIISGYKGQIKCVLQILVVVSKLVVYVGGGVINVYCEFQLCELVEKLKLLVVLFLMGFGVFLVIYLQVLGMLGMYGIYEVNMIMYYLDVIFVVGVCFDDWIINNLVKYCLNVMVLYIDIDLILILKIVLVDVLIVGDVWLVLEQMLELLEQEEVQQLLDDICDWW